MKSCWYVLLIHFHSLGQRCFLKFACLGLKLQKDVHKSLRSLGLSVEGVFVYYALFVDNCLLYSFYCLTEAIFVSFPTFAGYKQSFVYVIVVEDSIFNKASSQKSLNFPRRGQLSTLMSVFSRPDSHQAHHSPSHHHSIDLKLQDLRLLVQTQGEFSF